MSIFKNNYFLERYIIIWISVVFGFTYVFMVSIPSIDQRLILLNKVIAGEVKADYLYAMYFMVFISQFFINISGYPIYILAIVDFIGIIFLFQCAYYSFIKLFPNIISRFAGFLFLVVTTPLLFTQHFYHPSDFFAVGLMFFIIVAAHEGRYLLLAALCLLSGMLWEKVLFVPLFFLIYTSYINGFYKGILLSLPVTISTAIYFISWRLFFPLAPRIHLLTWEQLFYRLPRDLTTWGIWTFPLIVIIIDIFIHRRKIDFFWVLWLMYAPLLIFGLIVMTHFWGELRTFWILQPIFAGFIASWVDGQIPTRHWAFAAQENRPADLAQEANGANG